METRRNEDDSVFLKGSLGNVLQMDILCKHIIWQPVEITPAFGTP